MRKYKIVIDKIYICQSNNNNIIKNISICLNFDRFKKCLLGVCTKIRYHEIKTNNRNTVTGYIEAKDKLIPFLSRVSKDMKQVDAELWANITYGSPHLSEWNELFANNNRSTI